MDPVPDRVEEAVRSLIDGDSDRALARLEKIDQEKLAVTWASARTKGRTIRAADISPTAPPVDVTEPSVDALTVFREECFQCAYCGKRTIYPLVLRELSRAFPQGFLYNKNYRNPPHDSHWVYSTHAASLDHIVPKSRTAHPDRRSNLATACWQCNLLKRARTPKERGLVLRRGRPPCAWDGLFGLYPALASAVSAMSPAVPPPPRGVGGASREPATLQGPTISPDELRRGMWVRATPAGRTARRSYRISQVEPEVRMVEGWYRDHDGLYTEGSEWRLDPTRPIELLSTTAPRPGSRRGEFSA